MRRASGSERPCPRPALILALCALPGMVAAAVLDPPPSDHAPDQLVIELRDTIGEPADLLFEQGVPFATVTPDHDTTLDRLNAEHGVRAIRPLAGAAVSGRNDRLATGALAQRRLANLSRIDAVRARFAARSKRAIAGARPPDLAHVYVVDLAPGTDVARAAARYAADKHVVWAHPNDLFRAVAEALPSVPVIPNDFFVTDPATPGFWRQGSWGQTVPDLWGLARIHALEAWNHLPDPLTSPGAGIVVAVVDTGLDYAHPDIAANVWTNPAEIPGNGVDDDGNGYIDDVRGWDFTTVTGGCAGAGKSRDGDPFDDNGHGTHVSGTIAAAGNNGAGIVGVAPRARIMPVKGLDDRGCGLLSDLAAGIMYAADNGADVVNLSLGAPGFGSSLIEESLRYAHDLGVVVVAAAGNGAADALNLSPANSEFAIAVSAFDPSDQITFFSNFGQKIDVAAPGGGTDTPPPVYKPFYDVLSLRSSGSVFAPEATVAGSYLRLAGTSMAAPHVAGAAALVLGHEPGLTNEDVRQVLHIGADDIAPAGFDPQAGYGRLNVDRAIAVVSVPQAYIAAPSSLAGLPRGTIAITGSAGGPGFVSYQVLVASGYPPASFVPLTPVLTTPVTNGTLATWNTVDPAQFPSDWHTLLLRVADDQGRSFETRRTVRILDPPPPDELPGWPVLDADRAEGLHSVVVGNIGMTSGNVVVTLGYSALQAWSPTGQLLFTLPVSPGSPTFPPPSLGDLDGDGDLEIIVATEGGLLAVDHGLPHIIAPDVDIQSSVIVDDMDGDGAPWLVTLDDNRRLMVRNPAGTPYSPAWPVQVVPLPPPDSFPYPVIPDPIATGDLDGDGRKEIVTAIDHVIYAIGLDGTVRWTYRTPLDPVPFTPGSSSDVVLGDVDGDGALDVVYVANARFAQGRHPHVTMVLDGHGQLRATWSVPQDVAEFDVSPRVSLADLDRDGDLEIVLGAYHQEAVYRPTRLYAWHHNGAPVAGFPFASDNQVREPIDEAMVADVSGDTLPDLVGSLIRVRVDFDQNPVFAWNGQGQLLPGWPRALPRLDPFGPGRISRYPTLILTDLDGNGTLDLVSGIDEAEVHAIDLHVPADATALEWPMYRHDVGRTGRYERPGIPLCGNGALDPGEQCDDGNHRRCDGCSPLCRVDPVAVCGDGVFVPQCGEECDDGNSNPNDGCRNDCTFCGSGTITPPEECDDGNANDTDGCTNGCTRCGNGVVTAPEACDDGNLIAGDCCTASCRVDPADTPCFDDGTSCTRDVCDAGGICLHVPEDCAVPATLVETTALRLKDPGSPARRQVAFLSNPKQGDGGIVPPAPGSLDDPRRFGGFFEVANATPGGSDAFGIFLPSSGWSALGSSGYRYRGTSPGDPVRSIMLKRGRIKVRGGGAAWVYTLNEATQGRVVVLLRMRQQQWCAEAPAQAHGNPPSTAAADRPGLFIAQPRTPPPVSCLLAP